MDRLIQATIAILAIANPLGAAPVFLDVVGDLAPAARKRAALRVAIYVFLILVTATLAGSGLLRLFGLSIPAFQTGGGLIILLMGLEMLNGRRVCSMTILRRTKTKP